MPTYMCCKHCPDDCVTPDRHTVPCIQDNCVNDPDQRPIEVIWAELQGDNNE